MNFLTTKQVGIYLKRTSQRVVQLIRNGQLKAIKVGGVFLIDPQDLIGFKLKKPTGRPPIDKAAKRPPSNSV